MADDRPLREAKMVTGILLEIIRNNIAIFKDENKVAEEEERRWSAVVEEVFVNIEPLFSKHFYGFLQSRKIGHMFSVFN